MLGHIFEKSVNQKEMGAYYTPTAITRYMSEQGIWGYLGSKLDPPFKPTPNGEDFAAALAKLDKPKLWAFVKDHLATITVLDNACGSGAFLLAGLDVLRAVWTLCRKQLGDSYTPEINRLLSQAGGREAAGGVGYKFEYSLTRWLISRNIYGVDLEPGAVEIARLRLWLALITHAPDNALGIEPLPNIDYNLRCGNSLMGFTKPKATIDPLDVDCTDLLDGVNLVGIKEDVGPKDWKKGAPLPRALKLRGELVNLYRFATQAKVARQLHDVIEQFDERVGGHIEELWEGFLRDRIATKKNGDVFLADFRRLRDATIRPFHWYLEFPSMMQDGGAAVILTNPPWEVVEAEVRRFHQQWEPGLMDEERFPNAYAACEEIWRRHPESKDAWEASVVTCELLNVYFGKSGLWTHQGRGRPNLYKLFVEHYPSILRPGGRVLALVPGGIYHDGGCNELRAFYWEAMRWHEMLGFVNTWPVFDGVHSQQKFALIHASREPKEASVRAFFMAKAPDAPYTADRIVVQRRDLVKMNPSSEVFPDVRSDEELALLLQTTNFPAFGQSDWGVEWVWEVHRKKETMGLFTEDKTKFPFLEGANFNQFDEAFEPPLLHLKEEPLRQHFAKYGKDATRQLNGPKLAFRETSNNENITRTLVSAIITKPCGVSHTAWTERVGSLRDDRRPVLLCVLNSLVADYLTRRVANRHVTKEILEALRLPTFASIAPHAAQLTKLAAALEQSRGAYDETRAKMDAVIAHAYGLGAAEMEIVWTGFRVLREKQPDYMDRVLVQMRALRPELSFDAQ